MKLKKESCEVLKVWNTIPETCYFMSFSSAYSCKLLFSNKNFVKSAVRSRLTDETHSACIALKTIKYMPDIKQLSATVQQQQCH
jgi:hypothetical protein